MNENFYVKGYRADKKNVGLGGLLIIIASWNIISPLKLLASIGNLSQVRFSQVLMHKTTIPDAYFEVINIGYLVLLPLSIILLFSFFKQLKVYKYLEITNGIFRITLLSILCFVMDDINFIFDELAKDLSISIVISLVIIFYLFVSKRVKNTFVK